MLLSGDTIDVQNFEGEPIRDDTFLLLINAHHEPLQFILPGRQHVKWELLLDTASTDGFCPEPASYTSGDELEIKDRATMLLRLTTSSTERALHESWKKRQFEAPHDGETQDKSAEEPAATPNPEKESGPSKSEREEPRCAIFSRHDTDITHRCRRSRRNQGIPGQRHTEPRRQPAPGAGV